MNDKTATRTYEQMHEEQNRTRIENRMAHFIETWQPKDPYDASRFNAELSMIVREVYMDMQKPVTAALSSVMAFATPKPVFVKTGKTVGDKGAEEVNQIEKIMTDHADAFTKLQDQNQELRKALKPFADRVFNDNGDVTVSHTHKLTHDDFVKAHFALKL